MFGFVVANPEKLSKEQETRYKGVYCGLCEELGADGGFKCRMALTYDLAFLAIVLSSVNGQEYSQDSGRCPAHPLKTRIFLKNKYTSYAADMNIALAYYKYLDDWQDDKSKSARVKSLMFEKNMRKIEEKYPCECVAVKECLDELAITEKNGILIPDVPSGIFGKLLGAVFSGGSDTYKKELYEFGEALGKFIYVMDAAADLKSDIKRKRYNPLIRYSMNTIEPVLGMIMAECVEKYNCLPITQDKEIIENILFSGVWTVFESRKKGKKQ